MTRQDLKLSAATQPKARIRAVALPAEHGGWAFLIEPVLLGLLVAPSLAGLCLGVAAFAIFLTRQPMKVALVDRGRGRRYARTALAERFVLLYSGLAALGLLAAIALAGVDLVLPLLLAVPFGITQLLYDARGDSRDWIPELAGPAALATVSSSMAVIDGWALLPALALWVIGTARALPAVLYVRARLRLEYGKSVSPAPVIAVHGIALAVLLALVLAGLAPTLALVASAILLLRAAYGLSKYRRPAAPKIIGFQEMGFGLMTVLLTALGYANRI